MERKAVSQRASRPFSVPQLSMKQASASREVDFFLCTEVWKCDFVILRLV